MGVSELHCSLTKYRLWQAPSLSILTIITRLLLKFIANTFSPHAAILNYGSCFGSCILKLGSYFLKLYISILILMLILINML